MAQHSITITGNIISDPTFRQFGDKSVFRMRVGASRSVRGEDGKWTNYDQLFISVECWGNLARNCIQSLSRNVPVMVTGILVTHEWEDANEVKQSRMVLKATHVGVDLGRHIVRPVHVRELDPTQDKQQNPADAAADSTAAEPSDERVDEVLAQHEKEMNGDLVGAAAAEATGEGDGEPPF